MAMRQRELLRTINYNKGPLIFLPTKFKLTQIRASNNKGGKD